MAQVTILRRNRSVSLPAAGQTVEDVEVTYSTPAVPPRHVHLPHELCRPATADELAANPRYQMLPVDGQAVAAERKAIEADMKAQFASVAQTLELP